MTVLRRLNVFAQAAHPRFSTFVALSVAVVVALLTSPKFPLLC